MTCLREIKLYLQLGIFLENLMSILNKVTNNETISSLEVKEAFFKRFPEKDPPTNKIICKNVKNTKEREKV